MNTLSNVNTDTNTDTAAAVSACIQTPEERVETLTQAYSDQFAYDDEGHVRAYRLLAKTIDMWRSMQEDEALRDLVHTMAVERKIRVHTSNATGCPPLTLVRLVSGRYVEINSNGEKVQEWRENRSHERNAYATRFAVENGYTGDDVFERLRDGKQFLVHGTANYIEGTIGAMRAADTAKHNPNAKKQGLLWNAEVAKQFEAMKSVKEVSFSKSTISGLRPHEGFVLLVGRVGKPNKIDILGDAGQSREDTLRAVRALYDALHASTVTDTSDDAEA